MDSTSRASLGSSRVPVQPHCLALQLRLPAPLHPPDLVRRGRRSRHLKDRDLVVAGVAALEPDVPAVARAGVLDPALPEALLAGRRADVLLFGLGAGQQVDATARSKHFGPALW